MVAIMTSPVCPVRDLSPVLDGLPALSGPRRGSHHMSCLPNSAPALTLSHLASLSSPPASETGMARKIMGLFRFRRKRKLKMQEFDPQTANIARVYDYYLGGKDNFAADRAAAEEIMRVSPDVAAAAYDNRRFLGRAVCYLARSGVIQFIDIGSGLPTMENTHEIAAKENWFSKVVYVDSDPVVVNHAMVLVGSAPQVAVIRGDVREPQKIMENPVLQSFLDASQPIAVILAAILHFIDDANAYAAIDYLKDSIPSGSALVMSHGTADEATSEEMRTARSVYDRAAVSIFPRTLADVTRFFDGFDLVDPGVVPLNAWRPGGSQEVTRTIAYGAVAIKP